MGNAKKTTLLSAWLLVLLISLAWPPDATARESFKRVLAIHSYHRSYTWERVMEEALDQRFQKANLKNRVFHETLDAIRINDPAFQVVFYDYLKSKYAENKPDLIIATDNAAFSFLVNYRDWLFGRTPVVFAGVNGFTPRQLLGAENFTGVSEYPDMAGTLKAALDLFPKTRRLVVYGCWHPTYFANLKMLKHALEQLEVDIDLELKENWRISRILADVPKLPPDSLIIIIAQGLNDQGRLISSALSARLISSAGTTPVFSFWDFLLGQGIVGGKLVSSREHGLKAAELAITILESPPGSTLPPVVSSPKRYMFDYNQLVRFGLDQGDLPQGSQIINLPPSLWRDHLQAIMAVAGLTALLLAVIIFLAVAVAKRRKAEKALKSSEDYYRSLFEGSPTALFIQDFSKLKKRVEELEKGGVDNLASHLKEHPGELSNLASLVEIARTNQAALDLYHAGGLTQIGAGLHKYLASDDRHHFIDQINALVKNKASYQGEAVNRTMNGDDIDVIIRKSILPGHEQDLSGIMASITDVTRLKRMEQELRDSTQKLRKIFDSQLDAIFILDTGVPPRILDLNRAAVSIFGYSRREMLGRKAGMLHVGPETLKMFQEKLYPAIQQYNFFHLAEFTMKRKDGSVFHTENTVTPLQRDSGERIGWVSVVRDISGRVQAEEELKASEKRYRLLIQKMPTSIMTFDLTGRITYVNEYHLKVFGAGRHKAEFFLGKNITDLPGIVSSGLGPQLQQLLDGREVYLEAAYFPRFAGGQSGYQDIRGVPLYEGGEFTGGILIRSDATERVRNSREKRQLEAQLHQAQKMEAIGTLAGGIAHDFNNILAAITGFTELALEDAQDGKLGHEELKQVLKAADRAKDLVKRILTFSRRTEIEQTALDLNKVITGSVDMLRRTIPKMISIELDLDPEVKPIKGNSNQLEELLLNLGSNAKDAMPNGGELRIETRNTTIEDGRCSACGAVFSGDYVLLRVSDSGQGIEQVAIEQIFNPFYTTKEVGKGTGLGLSMVLGIVKRHIGHTVCRSAVGQGTSFDIYLPIFSGDPEPPEGAEEAAQKDRIGKGETILLVDDESSLREVTRQILERSGYRVVTAASGEEALDIFRDRKGAIDLVILDLSMPGMGGRKCLDEIKRIDPKAKVIIASGYARGNELKEIFFSQTVTYVAKPFRRADLLKTMTEMLDNAS